MPIDPRIALGVNQLQLQMPDPNQGMNALARAMQIKSAMQEGDVNALRMQTLQRGIEDQNYLRGELAKPDADPYKIMLGRGMLKEANDFRKNQVDSDRAKAQAEKDRSDMAHKSIELTGQTMGWLRQNPSLENANAAVQYLVSAGGMPKEHGQQIISSLQANPDGVANFADMVFRSALQAKEQLPKIQTNNTGGATVTQAIDPITGRPTITGQVANTQSPDNAATNARTAADNAAARAVQMRGQNLTDARAKETNAQGKLHYDPERGGVVNLNTGEFRPATSGGQPVPPKVPESTKKELASIDAQMSVLDGAIKDVKAAPGAFTFRRGLATMAGPLAESAVGRLDSPDERDARSYVYNVVSKVINERAGAAQSKQELARLRSFLPAETDDATQIAGKLESFKGYLGDLRKGYSGAAPTPNTPNAPPVTPASPKVPRIAGDAEYNALPSGATFVGPDGKTRRKP